MFRALRTAALLAVCAASLTPGLLYAATPSSKPAPMILLTWEAVSFVPPTYLGRILPSYGGTINAAAQIVDAGALVSQPDLKFSWYLNNDLLREGINLTSIAIDTAARPRGNYTLKVVVHGYGNNPIEAKTPLPLPEPAVVIASPLPGRAISLAGSLLQALPYFFNVTALGDLSFTWNVADQEQTTVDNTLLLTSGTPVNTNKIIVTAKAISKERISERATAEMSASIQ